MGVGESSGKSMSIRFDDLQEPATDPLSPDCRTPSNRDR